MATISKFEDLEIWQLAYELCAQINTYINREGFITNYELKNQLDSSSGSVMDNIAEGFERGSRNEFVNFLSYSKGSTGEVRSQLYRVLMRKYISKDEFEKAYSLAETIARKINRLSSYLNKSSIKGEKFKERTLKEPDSDYGKESIHLNEILNYFISIETSYRIN